MKLRKLRFFLVILITLLVSLVTMALADVELGKQRVIRVAGDNNFPPFEYLSSTGVYDGFNIDIMNAITIETGTKIEYHPMPWSEALVALKTGEVDAIQGMKYSEYREGLFSFSQPYLLSSEGIFIIKENIYIFEIGDLEGRRVAVQKGDIAYDLLSSLQRAKIVTTESQEEAIQLLLQGQVDAFVGNRITGQYFLEQEDKQSQIKIVGKLLDPADYCIAVLPQNKELLDLFNDGITKIKNNGTYDKIQKKWFSRYDLPTKIDLDKILFYSKIGVAVATVVFLIILWWNRILKREVSQRVVEISEINEELQEKMIQLQANLHFQKQLLDSTYYFLITLDHSAKISNINRKAIDYFNLCEELIGRSVESTIIGQIVPLHEIDEVLRNGTIYPNKEKTWEKPDAPGQEKRILGYSLYPIILASQEISGVIINLQDITEQKGMEKAIEREDRLRSLGQLVLGIAHEIRNPLMSILTYTQLLPKKIDNEQFRELFAQQVPEEINRLNGLVNELLDFARPKKSEPTPFSFNQLIDSVTQLFRQKLQEKKVKVSLELADALRVFADLQQIKQVFINIILNAIEAVNEGGEIKIRGYNRDHLVVIEIEDNGFGIIESDMDKIFEPFYTKKASGVGLGLSITYQLLKANNGYVDVKSSPHHGTTIIIQLPKVKEGDKL